MKAAGVALVILGSILVAVQLANTLFGDGSASPSHVLAGILLLVGGLTVWSLQQIREALIGGHPRDVKAELASRKAKAERNA